MLNTKLVTYCFGIISVVVLNSGCSFQVRQIPPDAALMKQIGLPVYPHAQPLKGQELKTSMRLGDADQFKATFVTHDDLARVQDFYAKRVPKNASKTAIALGFMTGTVYQWDARDTQKEITIGRIKDMTIIELQSMTLSIPTLSQSATPSAQP